MTKLFLIAVTVGFTEVTQRWGKDHHSLLNQKQTLLQKKKKYLWSTTAYQLRPQPEMDLCGYGNGLFSNLHFIARSKH